MSVLPDGYLDEGPDLDMELVFFPTEVPETISPICEGICLGSVAGTADFQTLSKHKVTHVLTVASNCVPEEKFESMKYLLFDLPDCPTCLIYAVFKEALEFMHEAISQKGAVFVHCVRGVSRSSTLVIAYLMHYQKRMFQDALTLVNRQRRCAYPNIGFQLQLQFLEKSKSFDSAGFNIFAEIVITIQRKLNDLNALIESIMEDFSLLEDADPWHHLGYFFENCPVPLPCGRWIPSKLVIHADDLARRVANLSMLFEGDGADIAKKVGEVVANWVLAHKRLLQYPDRPRPPPFDLNYRSLVWSTGVNSTKQVMGSSEMAEEEKAMWGDGPTAQPEVASNCNNKDALKENNCDESMKPKDVTNVNKDNVDEGEPASKRLKV